MMRFASRISVLVTCCAVALSASACGDNAGSSGQAPTDPSSAAGLSGRFFDLLPENIQEAGVLTVAGSAALPPAQFKDDDGTVVGYFPDLLELIVEQLGVEMRFEVTTFDGILTGLEAGRYDVGIAFQDTPERQEVANLISLYKTADSWVVLPTYTDTKTPPCGKRIGVGSGSVEHVMSERISEEECVAKGRPPLEIHVFPNNPEANTALSAGVSMRLSPTLRPPSS